MRETRRPTLRHLLLLLNIVLLGLPLLAIFALPIFDSYLIRQTERRLIAEAVVVAELYRGAHATASGADGTASIRPPGRDGERYTPYEAVLDLRYETLPPKTRTQPRTRVADPAADGAGAQISPLLRNVKVFNLSGIRVFDASGCVVASSGDNTSRCYTDHREVRAALDGEYSAIVRRRDEPGPPPPLRSIRRRSDLRVFVSLPVFSGGEVIGAVRVSRTSLSPLEALYRHRGKAATIALLCTIVVPAVTYFLSHQISKPVRSLTALAEATARGEEVPPFEPTPLAPREVIRLADAFSAMTERLRERARATLDYANHVSHELKTPLTGISGAVELLQDQYDEMSTEQRRRFLANVESDARRMEALVGRLLALARIEAAPDEAVAIELSDFVPAIMGRYGERVAISLADDLPPLRMSPDHLESALRNLVDNALRHGPEVPVEVSVRRERERVAIAVRDRGPGVPEAYRDRIFERFFTTERDRGGSGLGLSFVRAVAESRGGRVDFDSGPDGTTFHLLL